MIQHKLLVGTVASAIGVSAALTAIGASAVATTQSAETVRILTYNIHHGEGMDERIDLERIAALINRLEPDLVALQEVDRVVDRTGGVDQATALGELTGMTAVFGEFMSYQGGRLRHGLALPLAGDRDHQPSVAGRCRATLGARRAGTLAHQRPELVFVGGPSVSH